jgi:hypothetical protein
MEAKRDLARNYLITGEDQMTESNNEIETGVLTIVQCTNQLKEQNDAILSVTLTRMAVVPTQLDIANKYTLNDQQKFAFMIITNHLNGDRQFDSSMSYSFIYIVFNYVYHRC